MGNGKSSGWIKVGVIILVILIIVMAIGELWYLLRLIPWWVYVLVIVAAWTLINRS